MDIKEKVEQVAQEMREEEFEYYYKIQHHMDFLINRLVLLEQASTAAFAAYPELLKYVDALLDAINELPEEYAKKIKNNMRVYEAHAEFNSKTLEIARSHLDVLEGMVDVEG